MYRTVLILFTLLNIVLSQGPNSNLFGLGSHCRVYPYARVCLGASAKRSAQQIDVRNRHSSSDLLSALITRLMEDENGRMVNEEEKRDKQNLYGDNTFLEQLAHMVSNTHKLRRPVEKEYIDDDPDWEHSFAAAN